MDVFYWEDKEKQIDFLLNESQSQAKEIEGLRELIENIKVIQTHQLREGINAHRNRKHRT